MKKIVLLLIPLLICACKDEISYNPGNYFSLSATHLDFGSSEGSKALEFLNSNGAVSVTVTAGNEWCTAQVSGNSLTVSVLENILISSRNAKIQVTNGDASLEVLVRQAQRKFSSIAAVKNVEAIQGPGEITLKWENPEEANFSHVIVRYEIQGQQHRFVVDENISEYTIKELLSSNGEHIFTIQSVDRENDLGETVTVRAVPGKLVAFRFEKHPEFQFFPYYLRTSDSYTLSLRVGSLEYDANVSIPLQFEIDIPALERYNQENGTSIELIPEDAYSLPENYMFTGTADFQDLNIQVNITAVQDGKTYGLPLAIKPSAVASVSDIIPSVILIFHVEDLTGWYTVDRLEKCGESLSNYSDNTEDWRRYIKRTGTYTWETGYVFYSYSVDEYHVSGNIADIQYITIDPATGDIFIQEGEYAISESRNSFDIGTNELHIEYLFRDWEGWWTHERMYNRSLTR
ncbi:MAG: DUF1735 domain-containing protein [Prevotellaceae bacterium]|jgi:hypothetical protein|nr:DUF1735 domain-containing protein [Prevotellaceae bacterium]